MTQNRNDNPLVGEKRRFMETLGYDIREDSQQSGLWLWTKGNGGSDVSFHSAKEAIDDAWFGAAGQTMGLNDLSSEQWDAMSFDQQKIAITRALSEDGDVVQDVVDDVLQRAKDYGFRPDADMVRSAVDGSACLLDIELTEEEIQQACERVLESVHRERETG